MQWWIWFLVGGALLLLEMATPGGFYFIFFGASALLVGLLAAVGIIVTDWLQWLLFSVFAIGATSFFRKPLLQRFGAGLPSPEVDSLVGETAVVLEAIQPGGIGKAELRGSSWNARNLGGEGLSRGQRCRVERVEGLMLVLGGSGSAGSSN